MNPRVCNELYLKAIKDETTHKDLFNILWLWHHGFYPVWGVRKPVNGHTSFVLPWHGRE
jgi:hypothetical protein